MFNSKECEITNEDSGKMVDTIVRNSNNIYVLERVKGEKYCMGKLYENWLWHRRFGHVNFKNLEKISKNHVIRKMPQITKPPNTSCKHYQLGKQIRVDFKTKENSTSRPLELIHTDLCGLMRMKGLNGDT